MALRCARPSYTLCNLQRNTFWACLWVKQLAWRKIITKYQHPPCFWVRWTCIRLRKQQFPLVLMLKIIISQERWSLLGYSGPSWQAGKACRFSLQIQNQDQKSLQKGVLSCHKVLLVGWYQVFLGLKRRVLGDCWWDLYDCPRKPCLSNATWREYFKNNYFQS